jgi:hypothetical protein
MISHEQAGDAIRAAMVDLRAADYTAYMASGFPGTKFETRSIIGIAGITRDVRIAEVHCTGDVDPAVIREALLRHGAASKARRVIPDTTRLPTSPPWWRVRVSYDGMEDDHARLRWVKPRSVG